MNKTTATLGIFAAALLSVLLYSYSVRQTRLSQLGLAEQLRRAMSAMMADFRHGKAATVKGVPADGQWHHEVTFDTAAGTAVSYRLGGPKADSLDRTDSGRSQTVANHIAALSLRRQPQDSSLIEVQLQARNNLSLTSNFKIRMKE